MSFAFELSNYSILTSLNERNIYIKFIDQVNFICYDTNVDQKELRLQFELANIYNIINNCFKAETGYSVNFNVSSGILKLTFNALVGGFLKINFEAILREKILSNDGQLTMNFNKIEQKYEALLKKFNKFIEKYEKTQEDNLRLIDAVANAEIILSPHTQGNSLVYMGHIYKINSTSITIESFVNRFRERFLEPCFDRVCEFYKLEILELIYYRHSNLENLKNNTLRELKIQCQNEGHFNSILGTENMPQLEKLEIYNTPNLKDIVSVLSSYKHKIKTIILSNCGSVNVVELQTYCQVNNIELNIS
jgi:hypothetical protein